MLAIHLDIEDKTFIIIFEILCTDTTDHQNIYSNLSVCQKIIKGRNGTNIVNFDISRHRIK